MRTTTLLPALLLLSSVVKAQETPPPVPPPIVAPPPGAPPPGAPPPYYDPPPGYMQPAPPPTHLELRPNYALLFSGVGIFGLGWIMDISGTLIANHNPYWESAIPVVGPFLQTTDSYTSDWSDLAKGFYVFDGLMQTAGFVLTVVGASWWHKVPVRTAENGLVVTF